MIYRTRGADRHRPIGAGGVEIAGMTRRHGIGNPYNHRDVDLPSARHRWSMKKQMTVVVEDILTMIGRIDHRGFSARRTQTWRHRIEHGRRVEYGIVVGIIKPILGRQRGIGIFIRDEPGEILRITVVVAEMRAIGMEHYELTACATRQLLFQQRQQLHI